MPKTLEIIIGDVKKVGEEIARRTIKDIEAEITKCYELKSLELLKEDEEKYLNELKYMNCHEFDKKYGQADWDDASDAYLTAKLIRWTEQAGESLKKIREKIKKITRPYVMACAKGSSAAKYYEALRGIQNNRLCFASVKA